GQYHQADLKPFHAGSFRETRGTKAPGETREQALAGSGRSAPAPVRARPCPLLAPAARSLAVHLQHRQEGLLRDLHAADLLHALLAFLLLLQKLLLARDVATVALGQHVL